MEDVVVVQVLAYTQRWEVPIFQYKCSVTVWCRTMAYLVYRFSEVQECRTGVFIGDERTNTGRLWGCR